MKTSADTLEKLVEERERRLRLAREVLELPDVDPELAQVLFDSLRDSLQKTGRKAAKAAPTSDSGRTVPTGNGAAPTQFDRIVAMFRDNGNKWLAPKEIASLTGLGDTSVRRLVYGPRGNRFERRDSEKRNEAAKFRLKSEYLPNR